MSRSFYLTQSLSRLIKFPATALPLKVTWTAVLFYWTAKLPVDISIKVENNVLVATNAEGNTVTICGISSLYSESNGYWNNYGEYIVTVTDGASGNILIAENSTGLTIDNEDTYDENGDMWNGGAYVNRKVAGVYLDGMTLKFDASNEFSKTYLELSGLTGDTVQRRYNQRNKKRRKLRL
ncbi:MAG: hypothetical protein IJT73_01725 [Selenomonadaceae bacterium]|nr:hypothetical protein [Selenomonadaceae bacterium]